MATNKDMEGLRPAAATPTTPAPRAAAPEIRQQQQQQSTSSNQKDRTVRVYNRRPRKPISCRPCRNSKLKCDRQQPCASCRRRECIDLCTYIHKGSADGGRLPASSEARRSPGPRDPQGPASPQSLLSTQGLDGFQDTSIRTANSLVDEHDRQDWGHAHWDALLQRPIDQMCQPSSPQNDPFSLPGNVCFPFPLGPKVSKDEILAILPPYDGCEYLVTRYFTRLSPLFHILHGPTFQKQYNTFRQDPSSADLSWIALLLLICSATLKSMESDEVGLLDIWPSVSESQSLSTISYQFRAAALICLSQDQFLLRHKLSTLEALLILIYTISNHEGVERAWTLLGVYSLVQTHGRC